MDYTRDKIDWADIVMSTGGDGTFLLAASMIKNNRKPVIGFNSVPERSEGYLCLPKNFSDDVSGAVEHLQGVSNNYIMYCTYTVLAKSCHYLHVCQDKSLMLQGRTYKPSRCFCDRATLTGC